ncbi:hypothetical protein WG954_15185 [Lacibacter sp. H375]|uniref:hypothetical protein n=1 Tax=Lacibacter sp. H375 TaxID=3133424 RepID=UPI0030BE046C
MKDARFDVVSLLFFLFLLSAFLFVSPTGGSIRGTVVPADSALRACAIRLRDTVKANVVGGKFIIVKLKPGKYDILIEPVPPAKGIKFKAIMVNEGRVTDVGVIQLGKQKAK